MDTVDRLGTRAADNLRKLAGTLRDAEVAFAVIGASALLLHNVRLPRTTRDLDLAVTVEGGLQSARSILLGAGLAATSIPHRFRAEDGAEIDVLAVDPTHLPTDEILLPDGDRVQGIGLTDAIRCAIDVPIGVGTVSVAPLCLLIAIKLHAAVSDTRPHDLGDACAALNAYDLSSTRRFDVDYERLPALTFETAGAYLAGLDAAGMAAAETVTSVISAISALLEAASLGADVSDGLECRVSQYCLQVGG